jgi:hypothetical protein
MHMAQHKQVDTFKPLFRQPPAVENPVFLTASRVDPRGKDVTTTIRIEGELATAFKSAIDELNTTLASRVTVPMGYPREDAVTKALAAVGAFRALVNTVVKTGNANYGA